MRLNVSVKQFAMTHGTCCVWWLVRECGAIDPGLWLPQDNIEFLQESFDRGHSAVAITAGNFVVGHLTARSHPLIELPARGSAGRGPSLVVLFPWATCTKAQLLSCWNRSSLPSSWPQGVFHWEGGCGFHCPVLGVCQWRISAWLHLVVCSHFY